MHSPLSAIPLRQILPFIKADTNTHAHSPVASVLPGASLSRGDFEREIMKLIFQSFRRTQRHRLREVCHFSAQRRGSFIILVSICFTFQPQSSSPGSGSASGALCIAGQGNRKERVKKLRARRVIRSIKRGKGYLTPRCLSWPIARVRQDVTCVACK